MDGLEKLSFLLSRAFLRSSAVQAEVRQSLEIYGRSRNEIQDLGVLPEYPEDYVPQVLQEMVEAVGDLHGVRRRPSDVLRACAYSPPRSRLTISTPGSPPGARGASRRGGVRAPVWQDDVHQRATSFEIHQDRSVTALPAKSEVVVHAQDPRCLAIWKPRRADVVEQGVCGHHDDPEVVPQEARPCFTSAEGEGDVREPFVEPLCVRRP